MIQQRTPEWFAQRRGRVTGSMVGAILGLSPYMTKAAALRAMVRDSLGLESEFTGNVATEWGTSMESTAIGEFEMEKELTVTPTGFHEFEDWLGASPDGLTSDDGLIEVKCPYGIRNDPEPLFKTVAAQQHYHAQMQIEMHCADKDHIWFWQWTPHGNRLDKVDRNRFWINGTLPILKQFHAYFLYELENNPDDYRNPARPEHDTPAAYKMVAEWDDLNEAIERATERKKDLLADLVKMAGEKNALIAGRKLTLTKKAGAVSYAKALKAIAPDADLEPYRGKPSEFWGLR